MENLVSHQLMIPHVDNEGNDLSHLMGGVKRTLAAHGINGFTVHHAKGTWTDPDDGTQYPDEDMHHIMADVPDTPEHDDLFSRLAEAVAHEGRQQAVYHRKVPVAVQLHGPAQHEDIDLSPQAGMPGDPFAPGAELARGVADEDETPDVVTSRNEPPDDFDYVAGIFA